MSDEEVKIEVPSVDEQAEEAEKEGTLEEVSVVEVDGELQEAPEESPAEAPVEEAPEGESEEPKEHSNIPPAHA